MSGRVAALALWVGPVGLVSGALDGLWVGEGSRGLMGEAPV